jgi:hypothetical protein
MSVFVDTPFGKLRKVKYLEDAQHPEGGSMSKYIWECPTCKQSGALSLKQLNGEISIDCAKGSTVGCTYHETHDFRPHLDKEYFV